jgi:hypothetical protein
MSVMLSVFLSLIHFKYNYMIRKMIMYIRFHERIFVIPKISFRKNVNVIVKKFDWAIYISILFITIEICKEK